MELEYWLLFKKNQGIKGVTLLSILKETLVLDEFLGIFVDYMYFQENRCTRKLRLKQNNDFLIKNCIFTLPLKYPY